MPDELIPLRGHYFDFLNWLVNGGPYPPEAADHLAWSDIERAFVCMQRINAAPPDRRNMLARQLRFGRTSVSQAGCAESRTR